MFKRLSASSISSFKKGNVSFNMESTDIIFRNRNFANLLSVSLLYELLSSKSIVNLSIATLNNPNYGSVFRYVAKHTVFKHFAAESLSEAKDIALELRKWGNVKIILDNSTEEGVTEIVWNNNFDLKIELIEAASTLNNFITTNSNTHQDNKKSLTSSLVPLKVTALCSPIVLEKMTTLMNNIPGVNDPHDSFWKGDPIENLFNLDVDETTLSQTQLGGRPYVSQAMLSKEDKKVFHQGLNRLRLLCQEAEKKGVVILLDAEQSNRQPAIELMAHSLWREFEQLPTTTVTTAAACTSTTTTTTTTTTNATTASTTTTSRKTPIIYNTYQMYLKRSPSIVNRDMLLAKNGNYRFAAKVVRGAYVSSEIKGAQERGEEIPLVASKEECDFAYNNAVSKILNKIKDKSNNEVSIFVATHNRESVDNAVKLMNKLQIESHAPSVIFATILGMSDHLSCFLGLKGYNVCKLVPYNEFEDVLPWLLRRLEENSDAVNAGQQEKHLLWKEVKRRISLGLGL